MDQVSNEAMFLLKKLIDGIKSPDIGKGKLQIKFGRKGHGNGHFNSVTGIAVARNGDILVSDTENHRIQVFTSEGLFVRKFGDKGSEDERLNYPISVAMTIDDHLAVTDAVNARLKVFSQETGKLIKILGDDQIFAYPYGLAVSADGYFVITDICKHCVIVMNENGGLIQKFGKYGSEATQLDHPYHVTIGKEGQIVVSDHGNSSVKFFDGHGNILSKFSIPDFRIHDEPFVALGGICHDTDGNLLVIGNSTIYIIASNGRLWEVINPSDGLNAPKCLTYCDTGHLVVTQSVLPLTDEVLIFKYDKSDFKSLQLMDDAYYLSGSNRSG